MKNNKIIFSLVLSTFILMSMGCNQKNEATKKQVDTIDSEDVAFNEQDVLVVSKPDFPDFIYDIGPRFNPIKKGDLDTFTSFSDFIGDDHARRIVSYKSLSVILLDGEEKTDIKVTGNKITGMGGMFTNEQIEFLRSFDYSTNVLIWAEYYEKNPVTDRLFEEHWTPYITIVPEKQAEYPGGMEALMDFLKENTRDKTSVIPADKLRPAKLYFTVSSNGTIESVKLDRTSNYPEIDQLMMDLIKKTPGTWKPAENTKGEKVDQELVVSFGLIGC